jgi:hypothetical protein
MKTFRIPVSWTVTATMEIPAESLEQAILIAEDASLPTDTDYLEDSFKVDHEHLEYMNDNGVEV